MGDRMHIHRQSAERIMPLRRREHRSEAHFAISAPNRLQESDSHYSDFSRAWEAAPVRTQSTRSKWRRFAAVVYPQTKADKDMAWRVVNRIVATIFVLMVLFAAGSYFGMTANWR